MNWINWPRKRKADTVTIGGEVIEIKPLRLEPAVELVLLVSPYLPSLEKRWPEFQAGLTLTDGLRPSVLSGIFRALSQEMKEAPGDMVKMVALLLDRPLEWVAQTATGAEILQALPIIDKVNRFDKILLALRGMARYE